MSLFRPSLDLNQAQLRPAREHDLSAISQLFSKGRYHHAHPGCENLPELLTHAPAVVLVSQPDIWAALVASRPDHHICWIAHVTLTHGLPVERTLAVLIEGFHQQARAAGVSDIFYNASPSSDNWLSARLRKLGYQHNTNVITYAKYMFDIPSYGNQDVSVHAARIDELDDVVGIDQACFEPQWTKDGPTIHTAFQEMPFFVIARLNNTIAGYAYAASYFQGKQIHLVRIAVLPAMQGQGIGLRLLAELTEYARLVSAHTITLNTQEYNTKAQNLYTWFGFRRTQESHMILHSTI